jgi:hypothetical protein
VLGLNKGILVGAIEKHRMRAEVLTGVQTRWTEPLNVLPFFQWADSGDVHYQGKAINWFVN